MRQQLHKSIVSGITWFTPADGMPDLKEPRLGGLLSRTSAVATLPAVLDFLTLKAFFIPRFSLLEKLDESWYIAHVSCTSFQSKFGKRSALRDTSAA